jgi:enoyl-CoA hydratase/carnithine racemase
MTDYKRDSGAMRVLATEPNVGSLEGGIAEELGTGLASTHSLAGGRVMPADDATMPLILAIEHNRQQITQLTAIARGLKAQLVLAESVDDALESLRFPVIAVVHGAAMGAGVEVCTISDFVVATPEAFFGTPEAQRGTIGATQRLAEIIGRGLA